MLISKSWTNCKNVLATLDRKVKKEWSFSTLIIGCKSVLPLNLFVQIFKQQSKRFHSAQNNGNGFIICPKIKICIYSDLGIPLKKIIWKLFSLTWGDGVLDVLRLHLSVHHLEVVFCDSHTGALLHWNRIQKNYMVYLVSVTRFVGSSFSFSKSCFLVHEYCILCSFYKIK